MWQNLDHANFFLGSDIVFVTVTVGSYHNPTTLLVSDIYFHHACVRVSYQGDYSLRIEALPDHQVQDEVMSVLRTMFPNITIPDPVAFHFPRWASNPLYRGSYSNWPPSFFSEHHENLRATVEKRLWFAGEATSQKYFGAWGAAVAPSSLLWSY